MIVVDTSVLVDHLRGRAEARESLRRAVNQGELLAASVLTKVEVLGGMRSSERMATHALFRALEWLDVTDDIATTAGDLSRTYRRSHSAIDVVDYVVASTAQTHRAALWTLNVKHFPMIGGLTPPY